MAREHSHLRHGEGKRSPGSTWLLVAIGSLATIGALLMTGALGELGPPWLFALGWIPCAPAFWAAREWGHPWWLARERTRETAKRKGKRVLGAPPDRRCLADELRRAREQGRAIIDKYLVGFELETGKPLWVTDDEICGHGCVFAKTGVGKTLWLESLVFQQLARGRASGCTFIDAKRDSGTLAHVILMALVTGRIEDLVIIDPFERAHAYNFVLTEQRADVKARKVLRTGLPPTVEQSTTKHYDRLAADSVFRLVRALETLGLAWSIRDVAVALSAFNLAYPHLQRLLSNIGARQALVELGHLAVSYRTPKGTLDVTRLTDNLRGIASELHAISGSEVGQVLCTPYTDLCLTDAILRGKMIYLMLPRLEEAESAARLVKVFREDLEVAIGEITSSRIHRLQDPHLIIIDEGASTFGPTWANLFELARKGRFALLFGAQSTGALSDQSLGLSEAFYERIMANVNLKVMMRIGDNRTASEMAEWIGKVKTVRKSMAAGVMAGKSSALLRGSFDLQARLTGGESQSVQIAEEEEDLVSAEELKHEMAAEKGLAWFDLGDGRIVKGRSLWVDADLPETWEGRQFLVYPERHERDEIGLAEWVDEQILAQEEKEAQLQEKPASSKAREDTEPVADAALGNRSANGPRSAGLPPRPGPLRLSLRDRGRIKGTTSVFSKPKVPETESLPQLSTKVRTGRRALRGATRFTPQ